MNIVLCGSIGRLPFGGYSWMDLQWLAGLQGLGHRVDYVEDCGEESWVYDWSAEELTTDLSYPATYLQAALHGIGFVGRWCYRAGSDTMGASLEELGEICAAADLFIVNGAPVEIWRQEYAAIPRRVFVDVDPGFVQIAVMNGDGKLNATIDGCTRLFTIGQRIGEPDCPVPLGDREWVRTFPPVALQHWPVAPAKEDAPFTTVMQWRGFREVEWDGKRYGQKDLEFQRFFDLPRATSAPLLVALTGAAPELLTEHGWQVRPGWEVTETPSTYRSFIQDSRGELSIAKHGYVATRGGWISDRTLCYLATGRPAIVQDTGLAAVLPVGTGLVTFHDVESAVAALDNVSSDFEAHSRAARRLAETYFAADRVLPAFLEAATS